MKEKKYTEKNKNDSLKNKDNNRKYGESFNDLDDISPVENSNYSSRKNIVVKKKVKRRIIYVIAIVLLLVLTYAFFSPSITLKGKSKIEIAYNGNYKEEGATSKFLGDDLTSSLKIEGSVDTKKVGTYKITYSVKKLFFNTKKTRTIKVVDEKAPTIELKGDKDIFICPSKKYKEEGATASDEYDGDLTDKIIRKETDDKITYSVKDSSNNKTEVTRKIEYKDVSKPEITLKGSSSMTIILNSDYKEPGYTAEDNCDGDLSKNVSVTGTVDAKKEGTYKVTYKVKDSTGNSSEAVRTVIVSKKTEANSGQTKPGVIYLTFDDGPGATTEEILNILKEEDVKATFFITNNGSDATIKRAYDEGHSLGIHTATHDYKKVYSSVENYFADFQIVQDRIKKITGYETTLFRFPGGSSNTISRKYSVGIMTTLTKESLNRGYRYYDWNVSAEDAGGCQSKPANTRSECVYTNVVNGLSKKRANNVLMHDIKPHTRDALRKIIKYGKSNGYSFETITTNTAMVHQRVNN